MIIKLFRDLAPIVAVIMYNDWFTKLTVKDMKLVTFNYFSKNFKNNDKVLSFSKLMSILNCAQKLDSFKKKKQLCFKNYFKYFLSFSYLKKQST